MIADIGGGSPSDISRDTSQDISRDISLDIAGPEARLYDTLRRLEIAYEVIEHAPVATVAESAAVFAALDRPDLERGHIKNLFLRDKRRRYWLVTAAAHSAVDLKHLRRVLGARGSLSFADAPTLHALLGVLPGAVTPFALGNIGRNIASNIDSNGGENAGTLPEIVFVVAPEVLACPTILPHPLRNDKTVVLATQDLVRYVNFLGYPPQVHSVHAAA